ncbi:PREDICTED: putative L-type lectin-domain containing receptor kinase V.2 [Camelina sativa]|uniref:L-type lectin-domain containing receptor kinase V.2 n=1 Tax=Camelina sativa TaxID=90675 RepID=A0ABM0Z8X8_CAMSA|nr:PREDICTED: putative L-type lectin-domain containing receptor kinase V.2 [Camelina sativa]
MSLLLKMLLFFLLFFPMVSVSQGSDPTGGQFSFNGFLYTDGVADLNPDGLFKLITSKTQGGAGQVLYQFPLQFKNSPNGKVSSFSTTFVFAIVAVRKTIAGCGLSFNISPTKGLSSVPNIDQYSSSSNRSVSVEFHTAKSDKPDGGDINIVGINVNSSETDRNCSAGYYKDDGRLVNLDIASGKPIQVWIEYNNSTKQLDVTMHSIEISKPKIPLISLRKDLSPYLREYMFTGFTSVGSPTSSHYILGWNFNNSGAVSGINLSRLPKVPNEEQDRPLSSKMILAISLSISGGTLVIVLVLGFMFFLKRKKFLEVIEDWEVQFGPHRFTYKDLFTATKGFKNSELLGKGGFGKVFKGTLPLSSIPIAVKKISHDSRQGMREFLAEIATIGRLRHPDLVRLLGYCRRKGELYLVYDYMPKGSLDKFLYNQPNQILDWPQRFKIIKDVASGLCYLHQQWVQVIIHRDIKPANILLDENMNAKLGDFGLAKLCDHGIDSQTSNVAGTFGYISPELSRTGKSSTSSDVFAFGVFMLEITCGRRPIEPRGSPSEMVLTDWVLDCWDNGDILQVVDERLGHMYLSEQVTLVLKLGLLCSHPVAATRPSMSSAIQFLDGVATLPHNLLDLVNARIIDGGFDALGESRKSREASSNVSVVMTESFLSSGR